MVFNGLIKKVLRYNKEADLELIEKAYGFSKEFTKGKFRSSGEPVIKHYLAVAYEVAELRLDDKTIAAALMHGLMNKGADPGKIKLLFGEEIFSILDNIERMTTIKKNITKNTNNLENLKKVLLAASSDLRALLIKICDKLVNLRDLDSLPNLERKRIAKESMEIYAPLAYRLGMGKIKSEIEDLSFKYLDEENYRATEKEVNKIRKEGERLIFKIKDQFEKKLKEEDIEATVQSRIKHLYSIYKKNVKLVETNNFDSIGDIVALRIIVNKVEECYEVLRITHSLFRPIPNRVKDYIAMPKPNGYQSLHTTVVNNEGKIFEVQIRTEEMHEIAEEGVAAHFVYKSTGGSENKFENKTDFDRKIGWLKQLVNTKDSIMFDVDFFGDQIFAFTPKGEVIELHKGATVIDFAYGVHSDLGSHCIGARINGNFVSLKEELKNGDVIEVLVSKNQKPSREWLKYTKTSKARVKVRQALKGLGKIVSRGYINSEEIKKEIGESLLKVEGSKKLRMKLALCCKPLPGDKIIGVNVSNSRLMVHGFDCKEVIKTRKSKLKVYWLKEFKEPVKIIIEAKDRIGILKEVLNSVSRLKINIFHVKGKVLNEDNIECSLVVDITELDKLNKIIDLINKIKDVKRVYLEIN